jgi:hypothetical protein
MAHTPHHLEYIVSQWRNVRSPYVPATGIESKRRRQRQVIPTQQFVHQGLSSVRCEPETGQIQTVGVVDLDLHLIAAGRRLFRNRFQERQHPGSALAGQFSTAWSEVKTNVRTSRTGYVLGRIAA